MAGWKKVSIFSGGLYVTLCEFAMQGFDGFQKSGLNVHAVFHGVAGMDDGSVIPAAKDFADFFEGEIGEVAAKIHGDLPGYGNFVGSARAGEVGNFEVKSKGDLFLNFLRGDGIVLFGFFLKDVAEDLLGEGKVDDFVLFEFLQMAEAVEGSFESSDVGLNGFGEEGGDFGVDFHLELLGLGLENLEPGVVVGAVDGRGQPGLKSCNEGSFELRNLGEGAVTGEEDLLAVCVDVVEEAIEFFLHGGVSGQELDVVNQEDVGTAVV